MTAAPFPEAAEAARLGRLRALHHERREHLYLCTCSGTKDEVTWFGDGTICRRCGHWIKRS